MCIADTCVSALYSEMQITMILSYLLLHVHYNNSHRSEQQQQQQQHSNGIVDSNSINISATWRNASHNHIDNHTQQQQLQHTSADSNNVVQSWTSMVTQFGRHRDVMKPGSSSSSTTARNRRSSTGTMPVTTAATTAAINHQYHQHLGSIQQQPLQQQHQHEHIADDFDDDFDHDGTHSNAMSTLARSEIPQQHAGSIATAHEDTAAAAAAAAAVNTALRQASVSSVNNNSTASIASSAATTSTTRSNVGSGNNVVNSNTQPQQQQQRRDQRVVYIRAAVLQDYETVLHPIGTQLQMIIHSTWGDGYYCGLNSIQIYSSSSNGKHVQQLELQGSQVTYVHGYCFEFIPIMHC
jgi:Domain of unknown function (DUF4457)